jgi:hypothetical protein
MKKLVSIAKNVRVNVVLCCGAAVLLSACGGGTADAGNGKAPQLAALSYNNPTGSSAMVAVNDASVAATSPAVADDTAAATPPAADPSAPQVASNFELGGYGPDASAAAAGASATQGAAPVVAGPVDGAPQLPTAGDDAVTAASTADEQVARSLASRGAGSAPAMDAKPGNPNVGAYQR